MGQGTVSGPGRSLAVVASLSDLERFVELTGGLAVCSVTRADGAVASSLVNAGLLAHPLGQGRVVGLVVRAGARKVDHLRRRPQATLVWQSGPRWVGASGAVELVGPDDPLDGVAAGEVPELLRSVFRGAGGSHDDWATFDRVMAEERRLAVLVAPARVYGNP